MGPPPDPRFLVVGHLVKPHGIRGEMLVSPLTDHPEATYAPGVVLGLGDGETPAPDPDLAPLRVEAARPFRGGYLVTFHGVENRSESELLRGYYLFREASALEPLAEGELFYHQLLGMQVVTVEGTPVGEVVEVFEMSPADLLQVRDGDKEHMIPFLEDVVVEVDVEARRMVVNLPEGLLEL